MPPRSDRLPAYHAKQNNRALIGILSYLSCTLLLVMLASYFNLAAAQASSINSTEVRFTPTNPTANDNIIATVSGTWPNGCVPSNPRVSIVDGTNAFIPDFKGFIIITTANTSPGRGCTQALTPWQETVSIGRLEAGDYQVQVNHNGERIFENTFTVRAEDITVTLSLISETASEATLQPASISVDLSSPAPPNGLRVNFRLPTGTATEGADFDLLPRIITIPSGRTSATINIRPRTDTLVEGDETVIVALLQGAGNGYLVGTPNSATITILDDDLPQPTGGSVRISNITGGAERNIEGATAQLTTDAETNRAIITLECSGGDPSPASIAITAIPGSAQPSVNFRLDQSVAMFNSCTGGTDSQTSFRLTTFPNDNVMLNFALRFSNPQGSAQTIQTNELAVTIDNLIRCRAANCPFGDVILPKANLSVRLNAVRVSAARSVQAKNTLAIGELLELLITAINESDVNVSLANLSLLIPDGLKLVAAPSECVDKQCQVSLSHQQRLQLVFQLLVESIDVDIDKLGITIENLSSDDSDNSNNTALALPELLNVSTNGFIAGSEGLTAGFIVTGAAKRVILSGESFGTGGINDAAIDLIDVNTGAVLQTNDDWRSDEVQAIQIEQLLGRPLAADTDAGMMVTLTSGAYGVRLRDSAGGAGTGLVSVTGDQGGASQNELFNVSTNGFVADSNGLIAGFIVVGSEKRLALSAESFGANGIMDPVLELIDINTGEVLDSNDSWGDDLTRRAELEQGLGRPLGAESDAGLIVTVGPGAYGARMRDADGGTGNGLVSVTSISQ